MATLSNGRVLERGTSVQAGSGRNSLDSLCIHTIRFLAVDAVERAGSGHPGAPMGAATMAYVLWDRHLKHNPLNPSWPDRDRFVLSAGHASMLLYALLHLTGYDLSLDELKQFRQWESRTPGHPERGVTPGVETTTGPLGQGFANGVGMAIAERWLAARFNRLDREVVGHHTYAIVSDGDLQEGITAEAASLAGHLGLGRLIYLYDANEVQIEGNTRLSFTEDVAQRFRAYGWQVLDGVDGNEVDAVDAAIRLARADQDRPSLIICRTQIGYGSPKKQGTAEAHGAPLGAEEARAAKRALGWPEEPEFYVPEEAARQMRRAVERGVAVEAAWRERFQEYAAVEPEAAEEFERLQRGDLPVEWLKVLGDLSWGDKPQATRSASGKVLNALASRVPEIIGGAGDLAPSTKTQIASSGDFGRDDHAARNLRFGVREHAMGAIANGIAAHGGLIPYAATFLAFSDYMRPAIRLAALMGLRVLFIFTHDSIGLGEDGPTHQPVEHLAALRAIPNLDVIRPADAIETVGAWTCALERHDGPTALVLSRQDLPVLKDFVADGRSAVRRGSYVLWQADDWEADGRPRVILMATGSEVTVALEAGRLLNERGVAARVVSMPSWELFAAQPAEYREDVLPREVRARVAVEAAVPMGWERWVGEDGAVVGMSRFGASAPAEELYRRFGITAAEVVRKAEEVLAKG